jgi:hypothetical protein
MYNYEPVHKRDIIDIGPHVFKYVRVRKTNNKRIMQAVMWYSVKSHNFIIFLVTKNNQTAFYADWQDASESV